MADGLDEDQEGGGLADDPSGSFDYAGADGWLGDEIEQHHQQYGHAGGLRSIRRQLRKVRDSVEEAERRGYERARAEQLTPEARAELRQQFLQELRQEDGHSRTLRRLGIPEPLAGQFDGLDPANFGAYQAKAEQLRAAGVTWAGDPGAIAERQRQTLEQQAAAQVLAQGGRVDPATFAALPEETRAQVLAAQTIQMQAAQAGGTQIGGEPPLERRLEAMRDQGIYPKTSEQAAGLAAAVNQEIEALRRQAGGEW
jgi:hypothetical protein